MNQQSQQRKKPRVSHLIIGLLIAAITPLALMLSTTSFAASGNDRDATPFPKDTCTPPPAPSAPPPAPQPVCCREGDQDTRWVPVPNTDYSDGLSTVCCYQLERKQVRSCIRNSNRPNCPQWGSWSDTEETRWSKLKCLPGGPYRFRGKCLPNQPKREIKICQIGYFTPGNACRPQYALCQTEIVDDPTCKTCPSQDGVYYCNGECPPGMRKVGETITHVLCVPEDCRFDPNRECDPFSTQDCGNGLRRVCGRDCKWGPCESNPVTCLDAPSCTTSNCSLSCQWETLSFSAEAECGIVHRRPFPNALVGVPVQLRLECGTIQGEVKESFHGATLDLPPTKTSSGGSDCPWPKRSEIDSKYLATCGKEWYLNLYATYTLFCVADGAIWDMDEYRDNIGRRSDDFMSPYVASDDEGRPLSGRTIREIMRELYPDDPLLIREKRTGSLVRHIYERSSAAKRGATGPNGAPAYNVQVAIPWMYQVRFEYTKRVPKPCVETRSCGAGSTTTCLCPQEFSSKCNGTTVDQCWCERSPVYMGADESGRTLYRIAVGALWCDKAEDARFPNQCRGVPIPVMEVQSIVR